MPGISEDKLSETSVNNRHIEILANTPDLQAVKHSKLNITQLAFYKAGEVEIAKGSKISMDSQGMAMLKMQGDKLKELTVADPSRKLNKVLLTVSGIYNAKGEGFAAIPNSKQNNTLLIVELPQGVYAGKSISIKL